MPLIQFYNLFKLSLKYWPITKTKLKHCWQKKTGAHLGFPGLVRFFLFYGCNLRCFMCGQWGETGVSKLEEVKNFLSLEKLKSLADEIAPHKSEIYLWGGEPTLHPDFTKLLSYLKNKKIVCTINTNAVLLEKYADDILKNKIDSLDVSLIGTEKIHDKVVRVPGAFQQVMKGLKILNEKSFIYHYKPLIKAIITINKENIDNIESLLNEIEKNPTINMSIIQFGWFTTGLVGEHYEKRMVESFGIKAKSWTGFSNESSENFASEVQMLVGRIRKNKNYKKPILFFPNIKTQDVVKYYLNHENNLGYKKCSALEREIDIRHNGDVVICADYPDYVIGNVNKESIQEIWQGEKLEKFRNDIEEKGLLPICSRCCGLFR